MDTYRRVVKIFAGGFLIGTVGLSAFYYLLLYAVTQDPTHPVDQFMLIQPWMTLLIMGFGIQMGMFWLMRKGVQFRINDQGEASMAAGTSTAMSGMAMVACCAHHLVDILPILGLSAVAVFLSEYQKELLIVGVVANVLGMGMMAWFLTGKAKLSELAGFVTNNT